MYRTAKIKKVTPIGKRLVCDITVADDHSYVGNGIVSHNSSTNLNFQNLSKHVKIDHPYVKEVVGLVTKSFIPPPGHVIMAVDFSQVELRLVAEFANELAMLEAYANNQDLHALTASKIMGIILEHFYELPKDVQKSKRSSAKPANFGLLYGQEAEGFMHYANNNYGVKMTLAEATEVRSAFFKVYPALPQFHEDYKIKARKFGYVRTLLGTKRRVPDIHSEDNYLKSAAEREAINAPIQGTGGLLTVFAMCLLDYRLPSKVHLFNTVHDSIMYYVPYALIPYAATVIRETTCNLPTKPYFGRELTKVKLAVDIEISNVSWKDLTPYDEVTNLVGEGDDKVTLHDYLSVPERIFKK